MNAPVSHLVCGYGAPKTGKTLDLGMTFCSGFFFAPSMSGLAPLQGLAGFVPQNKATVKDFRKVVAWLRTHKDDDKISSLVVDDLSLIGDHTMKALTGELGASYDRWNALNELFLDFFDLAANAPFFTCITSHEVGPAEVKGTWIKGGPAMPSKPTGDKLAKNAGLILRSVEDPTSAAADAYPKVYSCDPADTGFVTGNRMGAALPQYPLNMREVLHSCGVKLPRLHAFQEDMVEKLAGLIVDGALNDDLLTKAEAAMRKAGADDKAIFWTERDARARAFLRKHSVDLLKNTHAALLSAHGSL